MSSNAVTPMARGLLSMTSLAELLVLALDRRLSGSFVFETPVSEKSALVVLAGRVTKVRTAAPVEPLGRLLTDSGIIDRATLEHALRRAHERNDRLGDALVELEALDRSVLERTLREQLGRRLAWLGQLPDESAYGFYSEVDLLEDRPECGTDPVALIWRCLREAREPHPRHEAALAALVERPLRLASGAVLERFDLSTSERACFESLRARPLPLDAIVQLTGVAASQARRAIYALLITRQLEPLPMPTPLPLSTPLPPSPPLQSTILPPAPRAAAARASEAPRPSQTAAVTARPPEPHRRRSVPASSEAPATSDRLEHALERASRLVRERTRAEGAADAARAVESARESIARKRYADAEALLRHACQADPGNPEHLALHAWLRVQNGELALPGQAAQIVAALDRAVMKAPTSVAVRLQRAEVLKRLGRDEDAYKDFRFVARRDPQHLDAVREVRLYLMRTRDKQKQSGVFSRLFLR